MIGDPASGSDSSGASSSSSASSADCSSGKLFVSSFMSEFRVDVSKDLGGSTQGVVDILQCDA